MLDTADQEFRVRADYVAFCDRFKAAGAESAKRPHLEVIHIAPAAGGGVTLTATDGATLVCLHDPDGVASRPISLRFPSSLIKSIPDEIRRRDRELRQQGRALGDFELRITPSEQAASLFDCYMAPLTDPSDRITYLAVEAQTDLFPDIRRILPPADRAAGDSLPPIQGKLIRRIVEALEILTPDVQSLRYAYGLPHEAVVITAPVLKDRGFVVVAPYASDANGGACWNGAPDWLQAAA